MKLSDISTATNREVEETLLAMKEFQYAVEKPETFTQKQRKRLEDAHIKKLPKPLVEAMEKRCPLLTRGNIYTLSRWYHNPSRWEAELQQREERLNRAPSVATREGFLYELYKVFDGLATALILYGHAPSTGAPPKPAAIKAEALGTDAPF